MNTCELSSAGRMLFKGPNFRAKPQFVMLASSGTINTSSFLPVPSSGTSTVTVSLAKPFMEKVTLYPPGASGLHGQGEDVQVRLHWTQILCLQQVLSLP